MDIQPIINQISSFATHAYETTKIGALWCGHAIKVGYAQYAIPAAGKLSKIAIKAFDLFQQLLKSGPGVIFAIAGVFMLAGISAFKLADRKDYEEDMLAKTAWKTTGIAAFITATALTSFGLVALLAV